MFDKHDPYYIEYDVFESIEKTEKAVQTLIDLDYRESSSSFLSTGANDQTSWYLNPREKHHLPRCRWPFA